MAVLSILKGSTNKVLRTVSKPVKGSDKKLLRLIDDMVETMLQADGVGLAAPQIGLNIRVVVCRFNPGTNQEMIVPMINPEIIDFSDELVVTEEGCLSLPGEFGKVARYLGLTVKFLDRRGKRMVLKMKEYNARIVQHEIDHIDGKLFIDRAEPVVV